MRILLDTNVLVRLADRASSHHAVAKAATLKLESDGQRLCLVPQIVYEYWVVVTRPVAENGLGMSADEANRAVDMQLDLFTLLLDERGVFREWRELTRRVPAISKRGHDARIAAAMLRHGLTHLLTFNGRHFATFSGITIVDPGQVANASQP